MSPIRSKRVGRPAGPQESRSSQAGPSIGPQNKTRRTIAMLWKTESIRAAVGLSSEKGAALCPAAGMAGSGRGDPGTGLAGFALRATGTGDGGHGELPDPRAEENPSQKNDLSAQPCDPNGVSEDMATLVLDGSSLGAGASAGAAGRSSAEYLPGRVDLLNPESDAAIMLRVASGDEAGFNYLAEKYHRPMLHFLYRMVHNEAIAEELAQEVFLRVYRSRASYRAEAKFTTWLYRIATNLAGNHARDTRHERSAQTVYLDAPDEESGVTPDVADEAPTAEQGLLREERMKAIRRQVMALPERQRMAVLMHKYQGMDYREIGQVLKQSESATKSLLFRAYQTLRETLKDFV